jgi:hypothetical protein
VSTRDQRTNPETGAADRPRTRTEIAIEWVVWHFGEITAVGVPLLLAVVFTGWIAVFGVAAAAGWTAHEIRLARRQKAVRAGRERRQLPTGQQTTDDADEAGKEASA